MANYKELNQKFLDITPREQYLIIFSGLAVIAFLMFNLFIDKSLVEIQRHQTVIQDNRSSIESNRQSISLYEDALRKDPNEKVNAEIETLEKSLAAVDKELLALTSELIDPVQMRFALLELLDLAPGVSLVSFQVMPAQPLLTLARAKENNAEVAAVEQGISTDTTSTDGLYRHRIKIKLSGRYFHLRDYLKALETMSWTFFWQDFDYQLKEYPISELEVTLYSLSTKQEFIGV